MPKQKKKAAKPAKPASDRPVDPRNCDISTAIHSPIVQSDSYSWIRHEREFNKALKILDWATRCPFVRGVGDQKDRGISFSQYKTLLGVTDRFIREVFEHFDLELPDDLGDTEATPVQPDTPQMVHCRKPPALKVEVRSKGGPDWCKRQ